MSSETKKPNSFTTSLISGGLAGTSVDVALFPLDTLKTRLQSADGFFKSGGFRGVYSGLSAAAIGSAPGAALFFSTYETMKKTLFSVRAFEDKPVLVQMTAASFGEMAACLVRVPTEIVKQRMQTGMENSAKSAVTSIYAKQGVRGLYTGYWTMIARELPFSWIQFPLWEFLKKSWSKKQDSPVSPFQGAICGSAAGAFAAFWSTPIDVVKTRLMLGKDAKGEVYKGTVSTFQRIVKDEGAKKLFSGAGPRTMWIGIGGFVYFGVYEKASELLE